MAKQKSGLAETIVHALVLPVLGASFAVAYATGRWDLSALATGLVIAGALALLWRLDRAFIQPQLKHVTRDWLQIGLEMAFAVLEHVLGAALALFACSRVFGFVIAGALSWMILGGIVLAFPIVHGTDTALRFYRQLKEKERVEEQLRALAAEAELRALKAQINPHFLFNTLNTIAQLIHADSAQAEATVERLADMLRYVLAGSERGQVPLAEELAFVDNYLEIERARFGQRLRVMREIDPDALGASVPGLILQPLVENAVQHGQGDDGSLDVAIRVQRQAGEVVIAIADGGPGPSSARRALQEGRGHGLRNVDERLRKTYGQAYGLEVGHNQPRGAVIRMRIPA